MFGIVTGIFKNIFMGGSGVNLAKFLIPLLIIAGAVGYHFYTISSLKSAYIDIERELSENRLQLTVAKADNTTLRVELVTAMQGTRLVKDQRQIDQLKITKLSKRYVATQAEVNKLGKLLSKHDLRALALRKPGLIEKKINQATARLGKELEELTKILEETLEEVLSE